MRSVFGGQTRKENAIPAKKSMGKSQKEADRGNVKKDVSSAVRSGEGNMRRRLKEEIVQLD